MRLAKLGSPSLVNFLNLGARAAAATTTSHSSHAYHTTHVGHTTSGAGIASSTTLVHLGDDGVANGLEVLLLAFVLILGCLLVAVQPLDCVLNGIEELLLVIGIELSGDLLVIDSVLH